VRNPLRRVWRVGCATTTTAALSTKGQQSRIIIIIITKIKRPLPAARRQVNQTDLCGSRVRVGVLPRFHRFLSSGLVFEKKVRIPPHALGPPALVDMPAHVQSRPYPGERLPQFLAAAGVVAVGVGRRVGDEDIGVLGDGGPEVGCAWGGGGCCCCCCCWDVVWPWRFGCFCLSSSSLFWARVHKGPRAVLGTVRGAKYGELCPGAIGPCKADRGAAVLEVGDCVARGEKRPAFGRVLGVLVVEAGPVLRVKVIVQRDIMVPWVV
jgi:hypothetical protein